MAARIDVCDFRVNVYYVNPGIVERARMKMLHAPLDSLHQEAAGAADPAEISPGIRKGDG